jgi:hypothetical protein
VPCEDIRNKQGRPILLLGSDGSAISEDIHGAVAAAWLVLAVVEASENLATQTWLNGPIALIGTKTALLVELECAGGNKDERTIMAAEALALLMVMTRIRKALASVQLIVRTVLPIDNQAVVTTRKFRGVHLSSDAELTNQANADIWIAIRKEKLLWAGEFRVEDIRSVTASTRRHNICNVAELISVRHSKWQTGMQTSGQKPT